MTPTNASNYPKRKARLGKGEMHAAIRRLDRHVYWSKRKCNLKSLAQAGMG